MTQFLYSPFLLGGAAGALWSATNLLLLKRLAASLAAPGENRRRIVLLLVLKFGGLYPAAIALLISGKVSPIAFALSFTLVLALAAWRILLRPVGRSIHA